MAACSSLDRLFETPLPENPTLLQSIDSWKQLHPPTTTTSSSSSSTLTELFGELHFKEDPLKPKPPPDSPVSYHQSSDSLQFCTEGLGFESFDDVEDSKSESGSEDYLEEQIYQHRRTTATMRRAETRRRMMSLPPPITSIGRGGKPWVYLKGYREEGRFVLREIRIPTQELLHASRQDGRLRLSFVQHEDHIEEGEEEEIEEDEVEEEEVGGGGSK
ncbi:hypothetical protein QJS10_CPB13g01562 [Acorus calamus]|uniref:FAF domain-containing protein n=1 Tax=Acorus calamus TaxID=4465 RepID=A0AAV9DGW5_ACOCL|nr:hypothetical protein QJS10_CPB13g01562 [Acorus calamus]